MSSGSGARAEILSRIRSANGSIPVPAQEAWPTIPRDYRQASSMEPEGRIELLSDRLRDYGAGVYRCDRDALPQIIAAVLLGRTKKKMLVSPDVDLAWLPRDAVEFASDSDLSYAAIGEHDGVLTGCTVAIAATGTLGLCHGAEREPQRFGQGRRVLTLLPDYHLCLVRTRDVVETVPEGMRVLEEFRTEPMTLISGPSATADIEMTRIQGVHGPRTLDVIVYE